MFRAEPKAEPRPALRFRRIFPGRRKPAERKQPVERWDQLKPGNTAGRVKDHPEIHRPFFEDAGHQDDVVGPQLIAPFPALRWNAPSWAGSCLHIPAILSGPESFAIVASKSRTEASKSPRIMASTMARALRTSGSSSRIAPAGGGNEGGQENADCQHCQTIWFSSFERRISESDKQINGPGRRSRPISDFTEPEKSKQQADVSTERDAQQDKEADVEPVDDGEQGDKKHQPAAVFRGFSPPLVADQVFRQIELGGQQKIEADGKAADNQVDLPPGESILPQRRPRRAGRYSLIRSRRRSRYAPKSLDVPRARASIPSAQSTIEDSWVRRPPAMKVPAWPGRNTRPRPGR